MVKQLQGFQLAPQQQRLWMLQRDGIQYHAQCAVLLQGDLRAGCLREAFQAIVDRHQALRTSFQRLPGMKMPVQVVATDGALAWQAIDLCDLSRQEQEQRVEQLFGTQQREPFDLAHGPLCRATLIALDERRHIVLVGVPSLCADAWTLKNLVHELGQTYAAQVQGDELDHEVVQYLQFSEWQNELLKEEDAQAGRAYWAKRADASPSALALPFEGTPAEPARFAPDVLAMPISPELAAKIEAVAQANQSSVANVMLACWQTLLWRLTGQAKIVVGAGCDGRAYAELYGSFGLFAKWLPIQAHFERNLRFSDILRTATEAVSDAYEWQEYFIPDLSATSDEANLNRPFFAFGFDYEQRAAGQCAAGVSFTVYRQYSCYEPFKVKITCAQVDSSLIVEFHYDSQLFSLQDIVRLSQCYRLLVEQAAGDPAAYVWGLDILGDEERRRLLVEFNATTADYPKTACVHQLFEAQAERTPSQVAVVYDQRPTTNDQRPTTNDQRPTTNDPSAPLRAGRRPTTNDQGLATGDWETPNPQSPIPNPQSQHPTPNTQHPTPNTHHLTYHELNRRANRLAQHLRALDVGPDVIVGIHMERSLELVVALLGILKAGGAYLPLDLEYPPERLAFMMRDADAPLLLTQRHLVERLTAADQRPTTTDQRPPTTDQRPPTNDHRPTTTDDGPTADDRRPTTTDQRPPTNDHRPTTTDDGPTTDDRRPPTVRARYIVPQRSSNDDDGPTTDDRRPPTVRARYIVPQRSSNDDDEPTTDDRRPTTNDQRPTTNDQRRPQNSKLKTQNSKLKTQESTPSPPHLVTLSDAWPAIALCAADNPVGALDPANLAYVIYTSGSTGAPKGTMITHQGLINYLSWCIRAYAVAEGGGAPVHSPIGFDLTITSLFAPLLVGQTALLLPEDQGIDALGTALQAGHDLSLVKLTPSHLEIISQQMQADQIAGRARALIIGGEALWAGHVAFWRAHAPATRLINEYGPTETVVGCCVYEIPAGAPISGAIPIGRPIANTRLYLLDANLQPVPVGIPGELYVGGDGLARGYLGRPDLTAERFVPNPFAEVLGDGGWVLEDAAPITQHPTPNTRLYKTGDLARHRPDGELEYLGRLDQQVKLRGFRVELGEIESVLLEHPAVRESVVIAREDAPGEQRLVAYLVLRPGQNPTVSELRRFLQTRLPDYMLPAMFVPLATLPLTPNGKLDRRALPAPDTARPDLDDAFVAPRNEVEATLAAIWATVLRLKRVGINDNFFALGGDSILSIQIIAKAHQEGIHLTPRQLFQYQTIAELAVVADTAPPALAEQGVVSGPVPLTPIQHHFFAQELPNPHHFNQALLLTTQRRLDPALLEQALAQLLAHHDALRLRFTRSADGWKAINAAREEHTIFSCIPLAHLATTEQGSAISAAAAALQTSLDLSEGPLLRAALFDLGADQPGRLLLIVHHLAVDGVSWRVLLDDLQMAYGQLEAGSAVALPPKTTAFQQWAERLVAYAQSDALQAEQPYWQATLSPAVQRLPRDHAAGANSVADARTVRGALSVEETSALLHAVPAAYHTQINDALLTALAQAVGAWSGAALLVDLEGHGREDLFADVDLSRSVGWYTTLYPLLLDVRGVAGPGAALQVVKEQLRQVPQRGIGYGVLRYLAADTALRDGAAAEIKFNYLGQVDQMVGTANGLFGGARESSGPTRDPRGLRTHLLEVTGITAGDQLWLEWTYSAAIHEQATIEELAQRYLAALRDLIAHCLMPDAGGFTPSDFPEMSLTQKELDALITELSESLEDEG